MIKKWILLLFLLSSIFSLRTYGGEVKVVVTGSSKSLTVSVKRLTTVPYPLKPLENAIIEVIIASPTKNKEEVTLEVYDSEDWLYYSKKIFLDSSIKDQLKFLDYFTVLGALGNHKVLVTTSWGERVRISFTVDTYTNINTDSQRFDRFFDQLVFTVKKDEQLFKVGDKWIRCNPNWIRDHVHEMKGYKYWETDLKSFIEHILDLQMVNGAYYDFISYIDDPHKNFVGKEWQKEDKENNVIYIRIPVEADLEYLLVEGAYTVWQATGDNDWIKRYLPKLEKGLEYAMTDPLRWDSTYQLVKRPFTIDTWDFTNYLFEDDLKTNIKIRELSLENPFCIMHGDNSGMLEACTLLSTICKSIGYIDKARYWEEKAKHFKEQTNKVCWNGKFYTHQIHLDPKGAELYDETERLSLSNAYDLNRGLPDYEQAVSIIKEYQKRWERDKKASNSWAEWYSIDPPYEQFSFYKAGQYINGGILPAVGGELAKAAFNNGFEDYGLDILNRFMEKIEKDSFVGFLYTRDGKDMGGGPPGWGASAFISAIIEGLGGIEDKSVLFKKIYCSPKWAITDYKEVFITAKYGPSNGYFSYKFSHLKDSKEVRIEYSGNSQDNFFHILLPKESKYADVKINGNSIKSNISRVKDSLYVDFTTNQKGGIISVSYR